MQMMGQLWIYKYVPSVQRLMASLPLAGSMAHLDICLLYYVNKSRLACYEPLGPCFCCVAEMGGAQLGGPGWQS